ncbi:MAG: ion transporter, partial [Pseudomonas sp.]
MSSVQSWRERLYIIIFQTDTQAGRRFDTTLLLVILASLAVVMLDSIDGIHRQHAGLLAGIEWAFTLVFAIEYGL